MKNSVKETKKRDLFFGGINLKKYLYDIYEENETVQSYVTFEEFVNIIEEKYDSKEEILRMRVIDFENLVIRYNYSHIGYSENYDEEKDVEINYSRRLSFSDIF